MMTLLQLATTQLPCMSVMSMPCLSESPTPWMVASAGETDRDLAWSQLAQKLGVYNIT